MVIVTYEAGLEDELLEEELLDEGLLDEELVVARCTVLEIEELELAVVRATLLELDELELDGLDEWAVVVMIAVTVLGLELSVLDDSCCAAEDETRLSLGGAEEDKSEGLDIVVCSALLDEELLEGELIDEDRLVVLFSAVDGLKELDDVCCVVEGGTKLVIGWSVEDKLEGIWVVICSVLDIDVGSLL